MRPSLRTLLKLFPKTQSNISLCLFFQCSSPSICLVFTIILNLFLQYLSELTGRGGLCPFCRWWTESLRDESFHQFWMPLRLYFVKYLTLCSTVEFSFHWLYLYRYVLFVSAGWISRCQTERQETGNTQLVWKTENTRQKRIFLFKIVFYSRSELPRMKIFPRKCPGTNSCNRTCWTTWIILRVSCPRHHIHSLISAFMTGCCSQGMLQCQGFC